jgi:ubiquinone/menaquinone biosynthesis C-methylase UbiE
MSDFSKFTNYWDYLASSGEYQMGPQSHRLFLLDLLQEKKVESFLDVGCGTGPLYQLLRDPNQNKISQEKNELQARWKFGYKGTDYSKGMIKTAKKMFPEGDWEVEDARHLKEKDNSWDAVVLMHCLDHLDDYQAAIKEATRVAKKYVLIVLWRGLTPSDENNLNDKSSYGRDDGKLWIDQHLQDYSETKLKEAFRMNDLVIELETNGEEINKEGKFNTLFLLKKK